MGARLSVLLAFVAEAPALTALRLSMGAKDLPGVCAPGTLVCVDLADPLLPRRDAHGLFCVLAERHGALASLRGAKTSLRSKMRAPSTTRSPTVTLAA